MLLVTVPFGRAQPFLLLLSLMARAGAELAASARPERARFFLTTRLCVHSFLQASEMSSTHIHPLRSYLSPKLQFKCQSFHQLFPHLHLPAPPPAMDLLSRCEVSLLDYQTLPRSRQQLITNKYFSHSKRIF